MAQIKSKNTAPEMTVRSMLHSLGFRFRLHRMDLPGSPDIVLPRHKSVIFVHGCFWHRHPGCRYAYMPKSRKTFWTTKFLSNTERDNRHNEDLALRGWRVLVIWECELSDPAGIQEKLKGFLSQGKNGKDTRRAKHPEGKSD